MWCRQAPEGYTARRTYPRGNMAPIPPLMTVPTREHVFDGLENLAELRHLRFMLRQTVRVPRALRIQALQDGVRAGQPLVMER